MEPEQTSMTSASTTAEPIAENETKSQTGNSAPPSDATQGDSAGDRSGMADKAKDSLRAATAAAKDKAKLTAEKIKAYDFKGDARSVADEVKNLRKNWRDYDLRAAVRETIADAKKDPKSLWRKPAEAKPGKKFAAAGFGLSVALLLVLFATSGSFLGFLCLLFGLAALCYSVIGLKTEGRGLAVGGAAVSLLVLLCALGQTFGSSGADADPSSEALAGDVIPAPYDNEGLASAGWSDIVAAAENAKQMKSLNFLGFYPGMSMADAKTLRAHYNLDKESLGFAYNEKNGEVYKIWFSPLALDVIGDVANDFETAIGFVMGYFDLSNVDEVMKAEESGHYHYKASTGVTVDLWRGGFRKGTNGALVVTDIARQNAAKDVPVANKMRQAAQDLQATGVRMKLLTISGDVEMLLKETKDGTGYVSVFPVLKAQWEALLGPIPQPSEEMTESNFLSSFARGLNRGDAEKKDPEMKQVEDAGRLGPLDAIPVSKTYRKLFADDKVRFMSEFVEKLNELPTMQEAGWVFRLADGASPETGAVLAGENRRPQIGVEELIESLVDIPGQNFKMGKFEVTQRQWEAVRGNNPSEFKSSSPNAPVENVSLADANFFVRDLNALKVVKKAGLVFDLPTKEEWEYACKAGTDGDYCRLADGTDITAETLSRVAWVHTDDASPAQPRSVGEKEPNAFGLYDMIGNVAEHTDSCGVCGGTIADKTASSQSFEFDESLEAKPLCGLRVKATKR